MKAALFSFGYKMPPGNGRNGNQPEWKCPACNTTNCVTRAACRRCQAPRRANKYSALQDAGGTQQESAHHYWKGKGKGKTEKPSAQRTWAEKARAAHAKAQALEQMTAQAKRAGAHAAVQLAEEAGAARASADAVKPLHVRLGRAEDRLSAAEEKRATAETACEQASWRLQQAKDHVQRVQEELTGLEQEVAKARPDASASPRAGGLEDAVRMLVVSLHAYQELPPAVAEAAAAEVCMLPMGNASEDVLDLAVDGAAVEEACVTVPALDAARERATPPVPAAAARGSKRAGQALGDAARGDAARGVAAVDQHEASAEDAVRLARTLQGSLWQSELSDAAFGAMARAALHKRTAPL